MTEAQAMPTAVRKAVEAGKAAQMRLVDSAASPEALRAGLEQPPNQGNPPEGRPPEQTAPAEQNQAPTPAAPPAAAPAPPAPPAPDWEQQARTWRGRYEAEVPRLRSELDTMQKQLRDLTDQLKEAAKKPELIANQPPADAPWYSPEEREDFGDDLISLLDRRAKVVEDQVQRAFEGKLGQVLEENKQLRDHISKLEGRVQQVQVNPLFSYLDSKLPDWRQLNTDPNFLAWADATPVSDLDDTPMLTVMRRQFERGNADKVAEVFKRYLASTAAPRGNQPAAGPHGGVQPSGGQSPIAAQSPAAQMEPGRSPQTVLESLAGPGTPHSGVEPVSQTPRRVWTDAGIREFYADIRKGKFTEQERLNLERDLFEATQPDGVAAGRYRRN